MGNWLLSAYGRQRNEPLARQFDLPTLDDATVRTLWPDVEEDTLYAGGLEVDADRSLVIARFAPESLDLEAFSYELDYTPEWFSGMCKRLCIIDGIGAVTEEESVYVFKARDRESATRRFLELARRGDEEYRNIDGQRVRWAVVSLETVDELGEGRLSEREVHSKMREIEPPDNSVSIDSVFSPEDTEPGWSGV
jgi:hypothetical protein